MRRVSLFLVLLSIFTCFEARAQEPWAEAAALYQAKDYDAAYRLAESELERHPNHPVLIRLMAMCLLDAGYPHEAVQILRQGLGLHPDSVAMAFYLAQAYAEVGELDQTLVLVREILRHAPDSEYAERCRAVLPELEATVAHRGREVPLLRLFDLYLRLGVESDDNLPGRAKNDPEGDPETASRLVTSLYLAWRPLDQDYHNTPVTLGLTYSGYASFHDRQMYQAYDVVSHGGGVYLSRQSRLAGLPSFSRLTGRFTDTELDGEDYSQVSTVSFSQALQPCAGLTVGLDASYAWKDFAFEPEFPEYFDRDGEEVSATVSAGLRFWEGRVNLDLAYGYRDADADGSQFRIQGQQGSIGLGVQLPASLYLSLGVDYQQSDYPEFQPDPQRLDDVWTYQASLSRAFWERRLRVELSASHTQADSTWDFAEYEQTVYGLAVSLSL